jgi:hypothetical protein
MPRLWRAGVRIAASRVRFESRCLLLRKLSPNRCRPTSLALPQFWLGCHSNPNENRIDSGQLQVCFTTYMRGNVVRMDDFINYRPMGPSPKHRGHRPIIDAAH